MTKREENAIKTRNRLLKTAENMFKKNGFNELSVEEITKEAGVAKGTFYIYFRRKEDIVAEICRRYLKEIEEQIKELESKDIVEKLTLYNDKFIEAVELYGINICREWIKSAINPKTAFDNNDTSKWQYDFCMLRNILKTAAKSNELKENTPIELLTHLIISQLYGMMTCWCMSDGVFEPKDWTKKFCEVQLKAILNDFIKR